MTTTAWGPGSTIDLRRWPALATPAPAPMRATVARMLLRRVAAATGVTVWFPDGTHLGPADGPEIRVADPDAFFRRLARHGKIGFGEGYMAGEWTAPDLVAALTPLARNIATLVPPRLQWLRRFYDAARPGAETNDEPGARRNIAHHYDLSNELFASFLDPSLTYSSALFDPTAINTEPLEVAQARKYDRLLDATDVRAGKRVLEIGTGWGELAIRAARRGAQVKTITLSQEQASYARRRIAAAGLARQIEVAVVDYRDVPGHYDAVISVEMVEAVGERFWPDYFRVLDERLAPGGRIGLQAILMPHERMLASRGSWTWIHKYIFPGGQIPSTDAIRDVSLSHTRLRVGDSFTFGASYAETLRRWRRAFAGHIDHVEALGFDESFRRMWTFYLAYCEAGFRASYLDVAQFILTRPGDDQ